MNFRFWRLKRSSRASEARDCLVYDITKVQVKWVDLVSRTSRLMLVIGHRSLPCGLSFCESLELAAS